MSTYFLLYLSSYRETPEHGPNFLFIGFIGTDQASDIDTVFGELALLPFGVSSVRTAR